MAAFGFAAEALDVALAATLTICYKETRTTVYMFHQGVTTTNECGNVNGPDCSGDSGGQHIEGKFANCGPNPNVALTFYNAITSALAAKSAHERGSGAGGGHNGGTGTSATAGSGQSAVSRMRGRSSTSRGR
jgi:hypothetical protein